MRPGKTPAPGMVPGPAPDRGDRDHGWRSEGPAQGRGDILPFRHLGLAHRDHLSAGPQDPGRDLIHDAVAVGAFRRREVQVFTG